MFCLGWAKCYQFSSQRCCVVVVFSSRLLLIFWFGRLAVWVLFRTSGRSAAGWRFMWKWELQGLKALRKVPSLSFPISLWEFGRHLLVRKQLLTMPLKWKGPCLEGNGETDTWVRKTNHLHGDCILKFASLLLFLLSKQNPWCYVLPFSFCWVFSKNVSTYILISLGA